MRLARGTFSEASHRKRHAPRPRSRALGAVRSLKERQRLLQAQLNCPCRNGGGLIPSLESNGDLSKIEREALGMRARIA